MTTAQRKALDTLARHYVIPLGGRPLDLNEIYRRHAPRCLEIGCGTGEALLALARRHPENDYLGVEVYRPGIGRLLRAVHAQGLTNVRVLCEDAILILENHLPDRSLDAVYIFFPDPWPKQRHTKRRLIQSGFIDLIQHKIDKHGRLFIATDWEDYAQHIVDAMGSHGGFLNLAGDAVFAPRPKWRPVTRYERRAIRLGHRVRDFAYAQRPPGSEDWLEKWE